MVLMYNQLMLILKNFFWSDGNSVQPTIALVALAAAFYAIIQDQSHYDESRAASMRSNVAPICSAMKGLESTHGQVSLVKNWVENDLSPGKRGNLSNACSSYRAELKSCMTVEAIEKVCFLVR